LDKSWQTKLATAQSLVEGYKKMAKDLESKQSLLTEELLNLQKKYQALYVSKREGTAADHFGNVKTDDGEETNKVSSQLKLSSPKRLRIEAEPFVPQSEQSGEEPIVSNTMEIQGKATTAPEVTELDDQNHGLAESATKDFKSWLAKSLANLSFSFSRRLSRLKLSLMDKKESTEITDKNQAMADVIMYSPEVNDEQMEALKELIPSGTNFGIFNL
jgi:hypothetical protein